MASSYHNLTDPGGHEGMMDISNLIHSYRTLIAAETGKSIEAIFHIDEGSWYVEFEIRLGNRTKKFTNLSMAIREYNG